MLFNSLTYLSLLFFVVILFWNLSGRSRFFLIFISSLTFYGFWKIEFIILLLFSTISDWLISHQIVKYENKIKKKFLLLSLIINLSLLFYFKYLIFFSENTFAKTFAFSCACKAQLPAESFNGGIAVV